MATMNFKEALAKTIKITKNYVGDNYVSKDDFDTDLVVELEKFKETLNTASLNEIFVDTNEQDASYEGVDIFSITEGTVQKPEGGNAAYYRVPALTITKEGTIIAFADARFDTAADNNGRISVFCRRSEDKGKTWGPPIEVCKYPTNADGSATSSRARSMDTTILSTKNGKLFCLNGAWKSNTNNWATYIQTPDPDWILKLSVSEDDGLNWTTYNLNEISSKLINKPANLVSMLGGVGQGIEMYNGVLVFPVQMTLRKDDTNVVCATIMYSRDEGDTWTIASGNAPATSGESSIVEISPGELLMNARGGNERPTFKTKDMGETWEIYYDMNGLIGNGSVGCQGSSTKIRLNGKEIFLHSSPINNNNNYTRDNITLYASYDWKKYDLIRSYYPQAGNAEGAGYSCLATGRIDGQNCLFAVYERQGNISFRNLGLDLKIIASRADEYFEAFDRKFETNKENLLLLLEKFTANEVVLFEVLDNYLNNVTHEERQLIETQLTRLAGFNEKGQVIDRQNLLWDVGGNIRTAANTYYFNGQTENFLRTNRLPLVNDYTVDFDICVLGISNTQWNYAFSLNQSRQTGIGLAVDDMNIWKLVFHNKTYTYYEGDNNGESFIDKWIHITITKSSTEGIKVYHDNVLKYSLASAKADTAWYQSFVIGNDSESTKKFNGKISNFKIYDKVVNDKERDYLYNSRKKGDIFTYDFSENVSKIPDSLQENVLVNFIGRRTDEFGLISVYDNGSRQSVWGVSGEVKYDIDNNMLIFNKKAYNTVNTVNFLDQDFTVDYDVFIDGEPGVSWSQIYCIGTIHQGSVPGAGIAINGINQWNPISDGDGSSIYEEPTGNFVGRWIHMTSVISSVTGHSVYHDGQLLWNSQTDANINGTNSLRGYPSFAIGNNTNPIKEFHGKIANFRIYDKALTAEEVEAVINAIGHIDVRLDYSPNGQSFVDILETDWSKQKINISLNLDTCTNTSGENILSIGDNISSWAGNNIHFYYNSETRRLLVQCMQNRVAQNIEILDQGGLLTIEFSSEGLTVNGVQYPSSSYQTFTNVAALTSTQIGSAEGTGRSNATNYNITMKNK